MRRNIYDRLSERRLREQEEARVEQAIADAVPPPPERFHTNELSFVRSPGFKDKTFHVFTLTDIGPSPFSLVVGRSQVEHNADLETVAQQLLGELKKSLTHLEWIEPVTPTEVAGVDARRVEFRWRQQGKPVHQLQLIFLHHDEHLQPLLIQITGTSNNPKGMTFEERAQFDALVQTLELRHPPATDEEESGDQDLLS